MKARQLIAMASLVFLTNCVVSGSPTQENNFAPELLQTVSPTPLGFPTSSPTTISTLTQTPEQEIQVANSTTPQPKFEYEQRCVNFSENNNYLYDGGSLSFYYDGSLWELNDPNDLPVIVESGVIPSYISPFDGSLAWVDSGLLHIYRPLGPVTTIEWKNDWLGVRQWLSENIILIDIDPGDPATSSSSVDHVVRYDIFTGENELLEIPFEGIFSFDGFVGIDIRPNYSPAMDYAIYARESVSNPSLEDDELVLWDVAAHRDIWKITDWGWPIGMASFDWTMDGHKIYGVIRSLNIEHTNYPEIVRMDVNGTVEQISFLRESGVFEDFYDLSLPTLSSDENFLAILVASNTLFPLEKGLLVLNISARLLADYCIEKGLSSSNPLVWSPTGNQLALVLDKEDGDELVLLDVISGSALVVFKANGPGRLVVTDWK